MAIQLSPGVNTTEIDLTTVVPAVATSDGAIAGVFRWGPIGERVLIDSENVLVQRFAKPTNFNAETFFTAANFLSYGNRLYVSRGANTSGVTPYASFTSEANSSVSNNIFVGNTANLVVGMYVTQTSNSTVMTSGNTVTISTVNSTAIVLSQNTSVNTEVSLYFGHPGSSYNAIAADPDGASDGIVANLVNQVVRNSEHYFAAKDGTFDTDILYVAKYPGVIGNSLRISVCDTANSYQANISVSANINFTIGSNAATVEFSGTSNGSATTLSNGLTLGDQILAGNSSIGYQYLQLRSVSTNNNVSSNTVCTLQFEDPYRLHTAWSSNTVYRHWEFFNVVESAPGQSTWVRNNGNTSANDELHVIVVDDGGLFTGTPGTILEVFRGLSRATDSKNDDYSINYYKEVINQNSSYVWFANDRSTADSATSTNIATATSTAPLNVTMTLGSDGFNESTAPLSVLGSAYDMFASAEDVDVSLVMQGKPMGGTTSINGRTVQNYQLANYIIDNICEVRKDCVALVSPDKNLVLNALGNEALNLVAWRGAVRNTSYAVMDTGYKYMYDRYNDLYRWVPMNGDIAGLCVRTDNTNDAWWSPAGFNRGNIKNIVKLAYNPRKAERDILYPAGVNPVVTFPGQGTILYGDKTLQAKPSAFDRINVRRLFIVLKKAISQAAQYSLFEFNDAFTRSQFKNLVVPYLRTIQGRRGITDFLVVCDDTNNTAQIIDSNQFVGDIYIKPARSINYIQLNFVAVGTGVQFSEVVNKF
jgi:hypothetical protein